MAKYIKFEKDDGELHCKRPIYWIDNKTSGDKIVCHHHAGWSTEELHRATEAAAGAELIAQEEAAQASGLLFPGIEEGGS